MATGHQIDWRDFPEKIKNLIIEEFTWHNHDWHNPREIPQCNIIHQICDEYKCNYKTGWSKLRALVKRDKELKIKKASIKRKGPFDRRRYPVFVVYSGNKKSKHPWA